MAETGTETSKSDLRTSAFNHAGAPTLRQLQAGTVFVRGIRAMTKNTGEVSSKQVRLRTQYPIHYMEDTALRALGSSNIKMNKTQSHLIFTAYSTLP